VKPLCQHLGVSPSGFYDWFHRKESSRTRSDKVLLRHIQRIRIHQALQKQGIFVSRKRVARLMKQAGLRARFARVYRYRKDKYENSYVADNLRRQVNKPDGINQQWTTDLTYIRLGKHWIYLVVVLDLYSRRIVGWSLGNDKRTRIVMRALDVAVRKRRPPPGLILHSDRGTEYIAGVLKTKTEAYGMLRSMSRAYRSIDNAEVESFFQKLKGEYLKGKEYQSIKQVRKLVASYINRFYNPRLHSSLGYVSPMEYERRAA